MIDQDTDRRTQILDAALRVFARRGFHGSTIKEIGEEAGLRSPALIYWYFEGKEDLFQRSVFDRAPLLQLADDDQVAGAPPQVVLRRVAEAYYAGFELPEARQLFRVMLAEAVGNPEVAGRLAEQGPLKVLRFLVGYLEGQVERGRLRPHRSESAARAFMGMLFAYLVAREVLVPLSRRLPPLEDYVEDVVDIFLRGLEA